MSGALIPFSGGEPVNAEPQGVEVVLSFLGVGKQLPAYQLDVNATLAAAAGQTNYGAQVFANAIPPGAGITASYYGGSFAVTYNAAGDNTTGSIGGIKAVGTNGAKRANTTMGVDAYAQSQSPDPSALTTSLYAVRAKAQNLAAGRITHAIGWKVNTPDNSGGGTVDVAFGGYIANQSGVAGVGDSAALHIEGAGTGNAISFAGDGSASRNARIYSTAPGIVRLDGLGVQQATTTAAAGTTAGYSGLLLGTPAAASTGAYHGVEGTANYNAAVDSPTAIAAGVWARGFCATNKINTAIGVDALATYAGADATATTQILAAVRAQAQNTGAGRVTFGMGVRVQTPTNAGTMDVAFGAYIGRQDNAGATDSAALHIEGSGSGNAITWGVNNANRSTRLFSPGAGRLSLDAASTFTTGVVATAGRPAAATVGAGAQIYDSTLHKPIWSDGAAWRDAAGTAV